MFSVRSPISSRMPKRISRCTPLLLLLVILSARICFGEDGPSANVAGIVRDATTQEPLPLANIVVAGTTKGTSTTTDGRFELRLPTGSYELHVGLVGYKTETVRFDLTSSDAEFSIQLVPTEVILQGMTVYAASTLASGDPTPSSMSLQGGLVSEISSLIPDVFRSIQALPGIAVNNEFSAQYNVRGGNFDENLALVNGTQVYEPFHLKEADNASIGIFNVDLMRRVNFITGGFSARYGDKMSSVLNIEYRDGRRDRYGGSMSLSLTDLSAFVEGPIGEKGSFIVGGRKSYLEYVLSLLDVEKTARPSFYDVQGVLTYHVAEGHSLRGKFIHAGDDFENIFGVRVRGPVPGTISLGGNRVSFQETLISDESAFARYFSNLFALQSSNLFSNKALLQSEVSLYEQIDEEHDDQTTDYDFRLAAPSTLYYTSQSYDLRDVSLLIKTWEGKSSLEYQLSPFYQLRTGFSYQDISYNQAGSDFRTDSVRDNINNYPDTTLRISNRLTIRNDDGTIVARSHKISGYVENLVQLTDQFLFNAGVRADYFRFNRDFTMSPRLGLSYTTNSGTILRGAWGVYYQSPTYRQLSSPVASDTNTHSQRATHYVLGVEHTFHREEHDVTFKAEAYYKKYEDLVSSSLDGNGRLVYSRKNDASGIARGIDLYLSLKGEGFTGWISYGLLDSKEDIISDSRPEYPRTSDQRHTLTLVGDVDLGKDWRMNIRFAYGSGFPYTPFVARFNNSIGAWEWIQGEINSSHLPSYRRLDIRVSKALHLWGMQAVVFLDINNMMNFKNVVSYRYGFTNAGLPLVEDVELWPILPTLGIRLLY